MSPLIITNFSAVARRTDCPAVAMQVRTMARRALSVTTGSQEGNASEVKGGQSMESRSGHEGKEGERSMLTAGERSMLTAGATPLDRICKSSLLHPRVSGHSRPRTHYAILFQSLCHHQYNCAQSRPHATTGANAGANPEAASQGNQGIKAPARANRLHHETPNPSKEGMT